MRDSSYLTRRAVPLATVERRLRPDRGMFNDRLTWWWKAVVVAYLATAGGLLAYWTVTSAGLIRVVADVLAFEVGGVRTYPATITFFFTVFVMLAPLVLARFALGDRVQEDGP